MTDILLSSDWELTQAANGDVPICSDYDSIYQNITLEALTQQGDLFYDLDFGWSLYDFLQSEDDELTRIEIEQRVRQGLEKRDEIVAETIQTEIEFSEEKYHIKCLFQFANETTDRELNVVIGAVSVEVIEND